MVGLVPTLYLAALCGWGAFVAFVWSTPNHETWPKWLAGTLASCALLFVAYWALVATEIVFVA